MIAILGRIIMRKQPPGVPFTNMELTLIPARISNYIHYKVWGEITYPFPNFHGKTVEVWEWISNFIPYYTGHVIAYIHRCIKGCLTFIALKFTKK